MAEPVVALDRRQRRRQESIEEILDVALELMADRGVAGLSLGEVARRLGIRPPSLYVYFASKHAVYDAVFARGARELLAVVVADNDHAMEELDSLQAVLLRMCGTMARWAVEHPVYSQLLFWRPVPGFEPSAESYAPAVELVERGRARFEELQELGWLRRDIAADDVLRDWTIVTAGIVSQQLSNSPEESFETGRFTAAIPNIVEMFAKQYAAPTARTSTRTSSTPTRRGHREHKR
jgi:AcrR family transcriptional regulator